MEIPGAWHAYVRVHPSRHFGSLRRGAASVLTVLSPDIGKREESVGEVGSVDAAVEHDEVGHWLPRRFVLSAEYGRPQRTRPPGEPICRQVDHRRLVLKARAVRGGR